MNLKEAREIVDSKCWCCDADGDAVSNVCVCEKIDRAKDFIEGYEAGVRDAARIMVGACTECDDSNCFHDGILKLLDEETK